MDSAEALQFSTFVIIGGGIAGVSCAEHLAHISSDQDRITILSASPVIKEATNIRHLSKFLVEFDVEERAADEYEQKHPRVRVVICSVDRIDPVKHEVAGSGGVRIRYSKLCICSGAIPKLISDQNAFVIGIRDTDSVAQLQDRLGKAKKIVIVGNGGIATELVFELNNIEIVWVVKDESISAAFVDASAAEFLRDHVMDDPKPEQNKRRTANKYVLSKLSAGDESCQIGSALGPFWHSGLEVTGRSDAKSVKIVYESEVADIERIDNSDHKVRVQLKGKHTMTVDCDFIVSATGVTPNGAWLKEVMKTTDEGAVEVNDQMMTSCPDVFAAGDVCCPKWELSKHWFQMRLWSQARLMGLYAGQCMQAAIENSKAEMDFSFELFTHSTNFFGFKVILLGLFNGQTLGTDYEILLRVTKGREYVKAILQNGRMQGAILIGETDLEETFENLILDQIDLTRYGEDLLNPDIDIEDYFD